MSEEEFIKEFYNLMVLSLIDDTSHPTNYRLPESLVIPKEWPDKYKSLFVNRFKLSLEDKISNSGNLTYYTNYTDSQLNQMLKDPFLNPLINELIFLRKTSQLPMRFLDTVLDKK